jgi:hypothetical protein
VITSHRLSGVVNKEFVDAKVEQVDFFHHNRGELPSFGTGVNPADGITAPANLDVIEL